MFIHFFTNLNFWIKKSNLVWKSFHQSATFLDNLLLGSIDSRVPPCKMHFSICQETFGRSHFQTLKMSSILSFVIPRPCNETALQLGGGPVAWANISRVQNFRGKLSSAPDKKMGLLAVHRNPLILSRASQISHVTNEIKNYFTKNCFCELAGSPKAWYLEQDLTHVEQTFDSFFSMVMITQFFKVPE